MYPSNEAKRMKVSQCINGEKSYACYDLYWTLKSLDILKVHKMLHYILEDKNLLLKGYVVSDFRGDIDKRKSLQKIPTKDKLTDAMTRPINVDKFT
ncbi:hypothetical protein CR513_13155, partial [Mucuna pruriens]